MNTTTKQNVVILIAAILFSSCSRISTFSIAKRHYRTGYYIELAGNPASIKPKVDERANTQQPVPDLQTIVLPEVQPLCKANRQTDITLSNPGNGSLQSDKSLSASASAKHSILKTVVVSAASDMVSPIALMNSKLINNLKYEKPAPQYEDSPREAALSLFWIIIVIILIFWLLGILSHDFGVGGLINLLLIIALILLILWLLRWV